MEDHNVVFDCAAREIYSSGTLKVFKLVVAPGRRTRTWFATEASVEIREINRRGCVIADESPEDGVYAPNTLFSIDNRTGEMSCNILLLMTSPTKNFELKHSEDDVEMLKCGKNLTRIKHVTPIEKDGPSLPSFDGLSVCKFGAKWCRPCREAERPYQDLYESQNYSKVCFFSADVDFAPQLSAQFEARQIPLFVGVRDGQQVFRTHNVSDLPQLLHSAGIRQTTK